MPLPFVSTLTPPNVQPDIALYRLPC